MVERLQTSLHPVSAYVVLPVFALANAGVELGAIGKVFTQPVGHRASCWAWCSASPSASSWPRFVAVRLGLGKLPEDTTWPMVLGLGAVGGIGFTVSIFIAGLSFPGADLLTEEAKIAILLASLLAAVVGVVLAAGGHPPAHRRRPRRRAGRAGPGARGPRQLRSGSADGPGEREPYDEAAPAHRLVGSDVVDLDLAVVRLDDPLDDGEPQPGARVCTSLAAGLSGVRALVPR